MIYLLSRLFIKDRYQYSKANVRQSYGVLSGGLGIFLNILLFTGKCIAGILSNSIAITADAFNNLSDAGSSLVTLIGFKMAGQKPDNSHPFGHGRIEYLSGLLVALAIILMGFELLKSSVGKILHPEPTTFSLLVVGILFVSILVKIYMFLYNRFLSKKIDSAAMMATAKDSLSDTIATSVVLIATIASQFTTLQIDAYCGLLVGVLILYAGYGAAKDTINPLLGQAPDPSFVKKIEQIVRTHPDVLGIHDLIVHDYGPGRVMISLHAEVSADGNILTLHDMIDNIEHELRNELDCEAVIHMDPVCTHDQETMELKKAAIDILKGLDDSLTLHDFRVVKGPTHTNIIFDVVLPFEYKMSDREVKEYLQEKISEINIQYYTVIDIDKSYNS